MNRKGDLNLNLRNIFNLAIGALLLVFVVFASYKLYGLLINGEGDVRAEQNLNLLERQIKESQKTGNDTQLILQMPLHHVLIGFGDDDEQIHFSGESSEYMRFIDFGEVTGAPLDLPRPCDNSCICVFRMADAGNLDPRSEKNFALDLENVECREFKDVDSISGSWRELRFKKELWLTKIDRDIVLNAPSNVLVFDGSHGPIFITIHTDRNSITLSGQTES